MGTDVIALGAWCDLVPPEQSTASPGGASFVVHEFAVLRDGRRLTLHRERGFTTWTRTAGAPGAGDPWQDLTADSIERSVLTSVLPDEDDGDEHPYAWLAGLLGRLGVPVTAQELRGVPYAVELSDAVRARLATSPELRRGGAPRSRA